MDMNDNPVDAGTGSTSPQSLSLDEAADLLVASERDREKPDNAPKAAEDNSEQAPGGEENPEETAAAEDDWLSEEGEETAEAKEEDDKPETPETGQFVGKSAKVKLEDGTITTVEDLISRGMRQQDYSRKTAELSQERDTLKAKYEAVQALEESLSFQRDLAIQLLQAMEPQLPDPELRTKDPLAYVEKVAEYEAMNRQWQSLTQNFQQQTSAQKQAADAYQQMQLRELERSEGLKLMELEPVLKDSKKRVKAIADIREVGQKYYNLTDADTDRIFDHRWGRVLLDATRYRKGLERATAAKAAPSGQTPKPPQTPGRRVTSQDINASRINQIAQRARQSGSLEDVAELMLAEQKLRK